MNNLKIEGYAAFFNEVDSHNDKILPGAFSKCIQFIKKYNYTIPIFYEHNENFIIGKIIKFKQTKKGLWIQAEIFDPIHIQKLEKLFEAKIAMGFSIGYSPMAANWISNGHKTYATVTDEQRNLVDIHLHEVSVVKWASNSHCVVKKSKRQ